MQGGASGSPYQTSSAAASDASLHSSIAADDKLTLSGFEGPEKLLEIWFKQRPARPEDHPNNTSSDEDSSDASLSDCEKPAHHYASNTKEAADGHWTFRRAGLRAVDRATWEGMLDIVQCRVLSVIKNEFADAFLLSESSMFVYESRIMLKTCGTTTLLHAVPRILEIAKDLCGLSEIQAVFYSRKAFLFPERQAWPHGKWGDEVAYLDNIFPSDSFDTSGYVVGKINGDHWCLYMCTPAGMDMDGNVIKPSFEEPSTSDDDDLAAADDEDDVTLEILMTNLDPQAMKTFWRTEAELADGKLPDNKHALKHRFQGPENRVFTETGISKIYPDSTVDDYVFDPCGYSLNGLLGPYYYTIHVTPEDICSYASFETTIPTKQFKPKHGREGIEFEYDTFNDVIQRVVECFKPGRFSTTLFVRHSAANKMGLGRSQLLNGHIDGFRRRDRIMHSLGKWDVVFCHFEKQAHKAVGKLASAAATTDLGVPASVMDAAANPISVSVDGVAAAAHR
ncbi:spermidine resistance protein [Polyrhizophydium stewartii]|uniref:adenosylmethionine decarboxylase n=1 Tax=Polyrhizophydium stewartii TaxID=2732419 RepID=A0ABR4NAJ0_9FUNG|nr:spermidine resistance protein [Polyrhizophydium stewartii]